jgi:hypothetical protein
MDLLSYFWSQIAPSEVWIPSVGTANQPGPAPSRLRVPPDHSQRRGLETSEISGEFNAQVRKSSDFPTVLDLDDRLSPKETIRDSENQERKKPAAAKRPRALGNFLPDFSSMRSTAGTTHLSAVAGGQTRSIELRLDWGTPVLLTCDYPSPSTQQIILRQRKKKASAITTKQIPAFLKNLWEVRDVNMAISDGATARPCHK